MVLRKSSFLSFLVYGEWGEWSPCDETCDLPIQTKERKLIPSNSRQITHDLENITQLIEVQCECWGRLLFPFVINICGLLIREEIGQD